MSLLPRLVLLLLLIICPLAGEVVFRSQSGVALAEVCSAYEKQRLAHGVPVMEGWEDFDRLWSAGARPEIFETLKLRDRYEIVDWPAPAGHGDRVVMVGRSAFRDSRMEEGFFGERRTLGEQGRWILVRSARDGTLETAWVPEPRFREWIKREDLPLPDPDTAGMYPHEVAYWSRWALMILPVVVAMAVVLVIAARKNRAAPVAEVVEA